MPEVETIYECGRGHVIKSGKDWFMKPCPYCPPNLLMVPPVGAEVRFAHDGRVYVIAAHTETGAILAKRRIVLGVKCGWVRGSEFHARWGAIREMQ